MTDSGKKKKPAKKKWLKRWLEAAQTVTLPPYLKKVGSKKEYARLFVMAASQTKNGEPLTEEELKGILADLKQQHGVKIIVNTLTEREQNAYGMQEQSMLRLCKDLNISCWFIPIPEHQMPTGKENEGCLNRAANDIANLIKQKPKDGKEIETAVAICQHGEERSRLVIALALTYLGKKVDKALEKASKTALQKGPNEKQRGWLEKNRPKPSSLTKLSSLNY